MGKECGRDEDNKKTQQRGDKQGEQNTLECGPESQQAGSGGEQGWSRTQQRHRWENGCRSIGGEGEITAGGEDRVWTREENVNESVSSGVGGEGRGHRCGGGRV